MMILFVFIFIAGFIGFFVGYIVTKKKTNQDFNIPNNENELKTEIDKLKQELMVLQGEMQLIEYGVYKPLFNYNDSEEYKQKLIEIKEQQKEMIKNDDVCYYPSNFTYNNSLAKGKAVIKDNVKQIIRSFNNECDSNIIKVKFNNIETIEQRIKKSFEVLNKLNSKIDISIKASYLKLKLEELYLTYEMELKKQEEKERLKEERERLREEAKVRKEIEEAKKKIEKENTHYSNALKDINSKLEQNPNDVELQKKKEELENKLTEIKENLQSIDYREANNRAGYVYIISNIGAFGENVYKIGMTRRLEPLDRVNELGDASVPFNFDVHAMIFSDDAPKLENILHKTFENKRVNMVNNRREFFNITIEEIEKVVKENHDKTVDFIKIPEASQYRESLVLKHNFK